MFCQKHEMVGIRGINQYLHDHFFEFFVPDISESVVGQVPIFPVRFINFLHSDISEVLQFYRCVR